MDCLDTLAGGSVQIVLLSGAGQGYDQVSQVVLLVAVEGCVEQGDAPFQEGRCLLILAQLQQTLTGAGCDLCRPDPVQVGRVIVGC